MQVLASQGLLQHPVHQEISRNICQLYHQQESCHSLMTSPLTSREVPNLFSVTLENAMQGLEWYSMGVHVDCRRLHHLRFADDIVVITSNIIVTEQMLAHFDAYGRIHLQL